MADPLDSVWLPFVINYGTIITSILVIVLIVRARVPAFRKWIGESPVHIFWIGWIMLVVASGGMIAMMMFPGADSVPGWGLLKFDGAFTGEEWKLANEINTQIIVVCFTAAALINHPTAIAESYMLFWFPDAVNDFFPRRMSMKDRRTLLVLANMNSIFMYPLTFSTWMIPADIRPFWYTAVFLPLSLGTGAAAGIFDACKTPKNTGSNSSDGVKA